MRYPATICLAGIIASCSGQHDAIEKFTIGSRDFCLKRSAIVEAPPWVPSHSEYISDGGVAIRGCRSRSDSGANCQFDSRIINVGIADLSRVRPKRWEDFPEDAFFREVVTGKNVEVRSFGAEKSILIVETAGSGAMYLWSDHSADPSVQSKILGKGYEFESFCTPLVGASDRVDARKILVDCERSISTKNLSISYSYRSIGLVFDFEELDSSVIKEIESHYC